MWHLSNIPKIIHLYWGRNKRLSWLRHLTPISFARLNPDWLVKVWIPVESNINVGESWNTHEQKQYRPSGHDYLDDLANTNMENMMIESVDMTGIGIGNMSEVHKSDIFRLYLLSKVGGVWSDFDIFYTKPIEKAVFNIRKNRDSTGFYCRHNGFHSIGFLAGNPHNPAWMELFSLAKLAKLTDYQSAGRQLLDMYCDTITQQEMLNIPMNTVYPFAWNETGKIWGADEISVPGIGVHWFGGSVESGKIDSRLTGDNYERFHAISLLRLINKIMK